MELDAFLCDSIVSAEGKLYAQGIGWNAMFSSQFPARHNRIGIGILIRVPYTATNQAHQLEIRLENSDGARVPISDAPAGVPSEHGKIYTIPFDFNVGRPPLLPPGDSQMVPLAINFDGLTFEKPDAYTFVIAIDGTELKRLQMRFQHSGQPGNDFQ